MVLYRTLEEPSFYRVYKLGIVTIAEPFLVLYGTLFKKVPYRTIYNTFSINLKNILSMKWFNKELMVLNRTIPFTKEPFEEPFFNCENG